MDRRERVEEDEFESIIRDTIAREREFAEIIRNERNHQLRRLLLAGIAATMTGVLGVSVLFITREGGLLKPTFLRTPRHESSVDFNVLDSRIESVRHDFSTIESAWAAMRESQASAPGVDVISANQDVLDKRLARLEEAISESPERALSIPLLRRDVDAIDEKQTELRSQIEGMARDVSSIYQMIIGALGLLIISGFTMVAKSLLNRDPKSSEVEGRRQEK